uniref:Glycosyl transferase family 2 n=1 Tax=Candidatus Kentrum sp. UNK TaxID=2126344 RepID=A0A451B1K6_9GAMM|nr:MAG: Glycosyl transferase family 2 [Candidatus Kentron sp. UNK]VFK72161.1 MAG: Glycosyl transferase family 2 [Candidatus Kentron sp. UNK]
MKNGISLCMIVKNEKNRIAGCIEPIFDLLDQIVIVDDYSEDGTPDLLRKRFGIEVIRKRTGRINRLCDLRNTAFDIANTPWTLSLDADERMEPEVLEAFLHADHEARISGYFGPWMNYHARDEPFEDYKLFIFRKGYRMRGIIHENVQMDIRLRSQRAEWLDYLRVTHYPEERKKIERIALRRRRLAYAIRLEPTWYRYHWFLGLLELMAGNRDRALWAFSTIAHANSLQFPVECLNSYMALAEMLARSGFSSELDQELDAALAFHERVADDFEVEVNFRLKPWLRQARKDCTAGRFDAIRIYRFAW